MNLIDYNKVIEALDKERQFLLNREQYGAENVLVHHAINVIAELPIVRQPEIIRCKDCKKGKLYDPDFYGCACGNGLHSGRWFCADGKPKESR